MIVIAMIVERMIASRRIAGGMILLLETQAQRGIAGRTWLSPGLITTQPGGHLLAPGWRIVKRRLISEAGRRGFVRRRQARCIRFRGLRSSMRRSSQIRGRRAAADVTTKRTRHESQSYKKARIRADRITMFG
jgi:hypothetical protein